MCWCRRWCSRRLTRSELILHVWRDSKWPLRFHSCVSSNCFELISWKNSFKSCPKLKKKKKTWLAEWVFCQSLQPWLQDTEMHSSIYLFKVSSLNLMSAQEREGEKKQKMNNFSWLQGLRVRWCDASALLQESAPHLRTSCWILMRCFKAPSPPEASGEQSSSWGPRQARRGSEPPVRMTAAFQGRF